MATRDPKKLKVHKSEDRGGIKMPLDFFIYICDYKSTNSWLGQKILQSGMTDLSRQTCRWA